MQPAHLDEAIRKQKIETLDYAGLRYRRLIDQVKDLPRGTAVFDDDVVVYGYPRIGRILALGRGIDEHFEAPFWVEEKVDGYNVRIFRIGETTLALSRGGFVCPFSTDRLGDLMDLSILDDHPDLVVCAEIAGPDNPYNENSPPYVSADVQLFVFDLMRMNQSGFLPQNDRRALVDRYGLPTAEVFGRYTRDELAGLHDLLIQLNDEDREGVVLKEDSLRDRRVKYVTSNSNVLDIQATAYNIMDLPPEYFTNRLLRMILFLEEQGVARTPELERGLGKAFLDGLHGAVACYEAEHKVYRTHRCRFRDRANAERLMAHLNRVQDRHVQIAERDLRLENGYWILEFDRTYPSMNGLLGHALTGGVAFD